MSTPPSEATRAAELRARIAAQVRASRQRQGLGPHVTDPATLDRLAGRVLEPGADWAELATDAHDRRATVRHQGTPRVPAGTASNARVMTPSRQQ